MYQSKSWQHGVLIGAGVASETTAAATGKVGLVRRDPMAMKPFCGYNFADYWAHWLSFSERSSKLPQIFHVNWFRQDADGRFLWPGFGENMRVLEWIIRRCKGSADAVETAIGYLPTDDGLNLDSVNLNEGDWAALRHVDKEQWLSEMQDVGEYLRSYGDRTPSKLLDEHQRVVNNLSA